ncbi:uncharacterized protein At5g39570-like [Euphorbia lathyris]|uniref:uncharacterized protein At5g39570-like n=1 Tax=Euphorbia lathyris TaxID=212925 RepID=UPI0033134056
MTIKGNFELGELAEFGAGVINVIVAVNHYYSSNSNYSHYNFPVPLQDSITNNSIDSQIFTYDPVIPSTISYSISSRTDTKYIQYDPAEFTVSYSVSEFTETDVFEEYDPTPYGGGYNLTFTYGNPLPPSDDICYPRSASAAADTSPPALPSIAVPSAPIVTPDAKVEATGRKYDVVEEEESKPTVSGGGRNDVVEGGGGDSCSNFGGGSGGGGDSCSNFGGGSGGGEVGYGYEKLAGEMPYGYG